MRGLDFGLGVLTALFVAPALAQIYGGQSPHGTVVLSNFRGSDTPAMVISATGTPAAAFGAATASTPRYEAIVDEIAIEVDLPAPLLHAVISVESNYVVHAVSPRGARGLMQLMPETAQRFGVADPLDPRENIRGGARYLKWLLQRFAGDLTLALAGYNAGEDAVVRAGHRIPAYAETQRYVPRVMARLQRLQSS